MHKKAIGLGLIGALSFSANATLAEHVPGEVIVKLRDGASKAFLSNKSNGIELKRDLKNQVVLASFDASLKGSLESVIAELNKRPEVEYAEPNFIYRIVKPIKHTANVLNNILPKFEEEEPNYTPADARFGELWGLQNTGRNPGSGNGVEGADVDALRAWEITKGDRAVRIAVIDTGIDYRHPDLRDNMWVNQAELNGTAGVDDDGNGYVDDIHGYDFANNDGDPIDGHSHGTHCAGTIGASHNAIGVAGVMADVEFVAVKFLTDSGSGSTANAIESVDYATAVGVDLMSNSWGGGGVSQALQEAIERANEAGIVFTAAAGNSSSNNDSRPHYPSNYEVENVISVAASTSSDELASFSCYGRRTVHIAAPGHKILSTTKNGGYASYSGTSMATPHVSGVIGLLMAEESGLTPAEIKERIMVTSEPIPALRGKTINGGRINAYNVLTNTIPERNEPNPQDWETVAVDAWESAHPYFDNANEERVFSVEGAKHIRLRVKKFDLERGYDYLEIRDANGAVIEKVTGSGESYESFHANGDSITVVFKSDRSITKWGFEIDSVDVQFEDSALSLR